MAVCLCDGTLGAYTLAHLGLEFEYIMLDGNKSENAQ